MLRGTIYTYGEITYWVIINSYSDRAARVRVETSDDF